MKMQRTHNRLASWVVLVFISVFALPIKSLSQVDIDGSFQDYYDVFIDVQPPTGFLLNLGFHEFSRSDFCNLAGESGVNCAVLTSNYHWRSWYEKLRISAKSAPFELPDLDTLASLEFIGNNEIPIGVLYSNGNFIPYDTLAFYADSINLYVPANIPQEVINVFAVSNLKDVTYQREVTFRLDSELIFSNVSGSVNNFEIDFGDGQGFQTFPFGEFSHDVTYLIEGEKNLIFKLHTTEGTLISYSQLEVYSRDCFSPNIEDIISTTLPDGTVVSGEYVIFFGCDSVFNRPVIIIEGFDPFLSRRTEDICKKYSGFWEIAKERGLDLVLLKFSNNHREIQDNAQVLKALIRSINNLKQGNFENIVIGESMGGLITRIALAEMENNGEDHQVSLYTSFDSPHKGANTPLSLQEIAEDVFEIHAVQLILPFLDLLNIFSIGPTPPINTNWRSMRESVRNMYNAPASRQMLIRHRDYMHEINPIHLDFQNLLDDIGFPQSTRSIALINGGKNGNWQETANGPVDPEGFFINFSKSAGFNFFKGELWAKVSPTNVDTIQISQISIKIFWFIRTTNKKGFASFFSKAFDISPGGSQEARNILFSFVPVFSSIALNDSLVVNTQDLFILNEESGDFLRSKRGLVENNWTPFNDIYAGEENTKHVSLGDIPEVFNRYIKQEIMMDSLFIQNRFFLSNVVKDFHSKDLVRMGSDVNPWDDKIISLGDVQLQNGSTVTVSSNKSINLQAGFSAVEGSCFKAIIEPLKSCNPISGTSFDAPIVYSNLYIPSPNIRITENFSRDEISFSVQNLAMSPKKSNISWTLEGDNIFQKLGKGQHQVVKNLPPGQYKITCMLFDDVQRSKSKVFFVPKNEISEKANKQVIVPEASKKTSIYPVPAQDRIQWTDNKIYDVFVYNAIGQLLLHVKETNNVSLLTLKPGPYIIILVDPKTNIATDHIIIKE